MQQLAIAAGAIDRALGALDDIRGPETAIGNRHRTLARAALSEARQLIAKALEECAAPQAADSRWTPRRFRAGGREGLRR